MPTPVGPVPRLRTSSMRSPMSGTTPPSRSQVSARQRSPAPPSPRGSVDGGLRRVVTAPAVKRVEGAVRRTLLSHRSRTCGFQVLDCKRRIQARERASILFRLVSNPRGGNALPALLPRGLSWRSNTSLTKAPGVCCAPSHLRDVGAAVLAHLSDGRVEWYAGDHPEPSLRIGARVPLPPDRFPLRPAFSVFGEDVRVEIVDATAAEAAERARLPSPESDDNAACPVPTPQMTPRDEASANRTDAAVAVSASSDAAHCTAHSEVPGTDAATAASTCTTDASEQPALPSARRGPFSESATDTFASVSPPSTRTTTPHGGSRAHSVPRPPADHVPTAPGGGGEGGEAGEAGKGGELAVAVMDRVQEACNAVWGATLCSPIGAEAVEGDMEEERHVEADAAATGAVGAAIVAAAVVAVCPAPAPDCPLSARTWCSGSTVTAESRASPRTDSRGAQLTPREWVQQRSRMAELEAETRSLSARTGKQTEQIRGLRHSNEELKVTAARQRQQVGALQRRLQAAEERAAAAERALAAQRARCDAEAEQPQRGSEADVHARELLERLSAVEQRSDRLQQRAAQAEALLESERAAVTALRERLAVAERAAAAACASQAALVADAAAARELRASLREAQDAQAVLEERLAAEVAMRREDAARMEADIAAATAAAQREAEAAAAAQREADGWTLRDAGDSDPGRAGALAEDAAAAALLVAEARAEKAEADLAEAAEYADDLREQLRQERHRSNALEDRLEACS
eukprot:TRINITY_DN13330_c0_g1_i1.p1 TRINITY_DN13330_c0_g1~~TRINITY_DN13330_c0_g1_i1.p1  ORF type:complete len:768 (+),score=322.41 TRINITY_DN13330_c0_g1_i1:50-2305(+)